MLIEYIFLGIGIAVILVGLLGWSGAKYYELWRKYKDDEALAILDREAKLEYFETCKKLTADLFTEREDFKKLLSQKKSSETRLGQIGEQLVPFLDGFKYNPKDLQFIGQPIDYLVFDLDQGEIVFLEIKTGNSKLSKNQKTIRDIVKVGRVRFEQIRLGTDGTIVKSEENFE